MRFGWLDDRVDRDVPEPRSIRERRPVRVEAHVISQQARSRSGQIAHRGQQSAKCRGPWVDFAGMQRAPAEAWQLRQRGVC